MSKTNFLVLQEIIIDKNLIKKNLIKENQSHKCIVCKGRMWVSAVSLPF